MARLAIVTCLVLAVAGVIGVALPTTMSPPISLPQEWVKAINVTAIASPIKPPAPTAASRRGLTQSTPPRYHPPTNHNPLPDSHAHELPVLAARAGIYDKDYTDQPPPPPKVKPRPHKFTPAQHAACFFSLDLAPCCGPLSHPPPRSDECKEKWGDPDYSRQADIDFCKAQPIPPGQCGVIAEDGRGPVMVVPERKPGYDDADQVYTTRIVGGPIGG